MGWNQREIRLIGRVSNHNSDQDAKDEYLFDELEQRILMITKEHRYKSLSVEVM